MKTASSFCLLLASLITPSLWPLIGHADGVVSFSPEQATHVRTLAASCAACHGTQGNAMVKEGGNASEENNLVLAGRTREDLLSKLLGFRDGTRKATIMHQHSRGLSLQEIDMLATHFSTQIRVIRPPLSPQKLEAEHG
ncbi:COG2863 Cytochrome c553 [Methylophilaceae bacterium]